MTPGKGEAVVEAWVWGLSPAWFGGASTRVWISSVPAGSRGSQAAPMTHRLLAQQEPAAFSSKEEGQPSSQLPARLPAAWDSWLGAEPSSHGWEKLFPRKAKQEAASQHQQVKPSPFLWLVVYIAPVYSQLLP